MKKGIGIAIISFGFIISVASPYTLLIIGVPSFLIGLIILWLSKAEKRTKILWSLVPPILWLPLTTLWLFVYNSIGQMNAQKRDYYINYDFKGKLTVIESFCGNDPIIENDRLQFKIPQNGVYLINGELKNGHIDRRIFQKSKDGELIELKDNIWPIQPEEKDTLGEERIIGYWGGGFGTRSSQSNKESNFISINIETNKVYSDKQDWQINRSKEEALDSLIQNCEK